MTMVNGEILYMDGKFKADVEAIYNKVKEIVANKAQNMQ